MFSFLLGNSLRVSYILSVCFTLVAELFSRGHSGSPTTMFKSVVVFHPHQHLVLVFFISAIKINV